MNKKFNSGQKFNYEIGYSLSLLKLINKGINTYEDLQKAKVIGYNKIETYGYWLRIINLVKYENKKFNITKFGEKILSLEYKYDKLAPLILYKLSRGWNNGGHFYFSKLINDILYDKAFSLNNIITKKEIKAKIIHYSLENNVSEKYMKKFAIQNINTLSNSESGFGKLGMVVKDENKYSIYTYWPEPIICAYILYDRWENGRVAMKIDEIVKGKYNFGRLFFLDKDKVIEILEKLKGDNYINIETTAGLNQIRLNPNIRKIDILKEIN